MELTATEVWLTGTVSTAVWAAVEDVEVDTDDGTVGVVGLTVVVGPGSISRENNFSLIAYSSVV